jgi:hypothetical protein
MGMITWTSPIRGSTQSSGSGRVTIDDGACSLSFHSAAGTWQVSIHGPSGMLEWFWKGTHDHAWSIQDPDASILCESLLESPREKWTTPEDYRNNIHISKPVRPGAFVNHTNKEREKPVEPVPAPKEELPLWTISLDHYQLRLMAEALEFFERVLGLGQIEELAWALAFRIPGPYNSARSHETEVLLKRVKHVVFGLDANQSFGIYNRDVPEKFRVAYDMMKVLRKRLVETSIQEAQEKGEHENAGRLSMTVWNDEPFAASNTKSLIRVTK